MSEEKPQFDHDCKDCTFLGRHEGQSAFGGSSGKYDLYFCPQYGMSHTVIARFGNGGPDYLSGLLASYYEPVLAEARRRAQKIGLVARQPFGPDFKGDLE